MDGSFNLTPQNHSYHTIQLSPGHHMKMHYAVLIPEDAHRHIAVIGTGMGGHIKKYAEHPARWFLERGFPVVIPEWLNYGHSDRFLTEPKKRARDHIPNMRIHFDSYVSFHQNVVMKMEPESVTLFGHSLGAHIFARCMAENEGLRKDVMAAVFVTPTLNFTIPSPKAIGIEWLNYAKIFGQREIPEGRIEAPLYVKFLTWLAANIGFSQCYAPGQHDLDDRDRNFEGNRFTHDPHQFGKMIKHIEDDPNLGVAGVTMGTLNQMFKSVAHTHQPGYFDPVDKPILTITGSEDGITPFRVLKAAMNNFTQMTHVEIKGCAHDPMGELPHVREELYNAMGSFLCRQVPFPQYIYT